MGIEPTTLAWKAKVIPFYDTRTINILMTKTIDATKFLYLVFRNYKPASQPSFVTTTEFKLNPLLQKPKIEFKLDGQFPQVK